VLENIQEYVARGGGADGSDPSAPRAAGG